ncbi:uncharacterized protein TEOVI_000793400 [Trypanosoma equiperdum]|uniref:Uncharacterized protein n=2 Tax=Trypanozoon TaxID=39700 RepID=Q580V6_TRYB2|nr:hypothetical protein, conserved [Trypanosoma brucei brucei TREU927]AAX81028.1 hypothetical protein, conserved [Trypanosoma brucei]AAZ10550.1 hypothetical protein, conserved [Trypanosoma brucei brucei TREU927]SCU64817.1 hypothetical protein, conserved [Trypanosoma equiperdum]
MFVRKFQGEILKKEGHEPPKGDKAQGSHSMSLTTSFVDPENAKRERPVVDVSAPYNPLDETHQIRKLGVQKLAIGFLSLNGFTGAHEEVPYTDSMSTYECVRYGMIGLNVWFANFFLVRAGNSGSPVGHPRTRFAWNIAFLMGIIRVNLAGIVGIGGYFYSYEWLYTHGPAMFRIKDPSPNAYKRAWDEGQSCYLSRAAACIFPPLGYAIFMGRWKKTAFWFVFTLAMSMQYEYARHYILPGMRLFYSFQANRETQRQANWGSLAPVLEHRVDPDTNRNASVAASRYMRITQGPLQDTIWANATHENLPFHRYGMKLPNPYYNWQKAPQGYNSKPYRFKNDLWDLPNVLNTSKANFRI